MTVASYTYCPTPLRLLDVVRLTLASVATHGGIFISGMWVFEVPHPHDTRMLSGEWNGTTIFRRLRPEPLAAHHWYLDKLVKTRETACPEYNSLGMWRVLSKAQRAK